MILPRIRSLLVVIIVVKVEFARILNSEGICDDFFVYTRACSKTECYFRERTMVLILGEPSLFFPSSINTATILRVS
jgi:hypothetical protein